MLKKKKVVEGVGGGTEQNASLMGHLSLSEFKIPFGRRRELLIVQHLSPAAAEKMDLLDT